MKLFNEIRPFTGVALITSKEQSFGIEWWHWLIFTFIIFIISCVLCSVCFCCSVRQHINQLFRKSNMARRRAIYKCNTENSMLKKIKEENSIINTIDPNDIALNNIDNNNNKNNNKKIKYEAINEKQNAKFDSTSSESLDSLGTSNTAFSTLDENNSIYLPTTEIKSKFTKNKTNIDTK